MSGKADTGGEREKRKLQGGWRTLKEAAADSLSAYSQKHFPSGRSDNAIKQIQQNTFIMPFGFSLYHRSPLSAAGNKSRAQQEE